MALFDTSLFDPFADMGLGYGRGGGFGGGFGGGGGAAASILRLDLCETPDEFKVCVDVPGVEAEDLNIECEGNVLRISAQAMREDVKNAKWHRVERGGNIVASRSLRFPDSVDMQRVEAKLDNGVLNICIGKRPESQARRLEIKSRGEERGIGVERPQRCEERYEAPRREAPRYEERREPLVIPVAPAAERGGGGGAEREVAGLEARERRERFERESVSKVGEKLGGVGEAQAMREGALEREQRQVGGAEKGYEKAYEAKGYATKGYPAEREREPLQQRREGEAVVVAPVEAEQRAGRGAGAEHIAVRATEPSEFGRGREGGAAWEAEPRAAAAAATAEPAKVMYVTRPAEGTAAHRERERQGVAEEEERGEGPEHKGGIIHKMTHAMGETAHKVGAKLRGEE